MHSVLLPLAALLSAGAAASDHPATGLSATIGLEKVVHQVEMVDPVFPSSPRVYNVVQFNNRRGFPVEYAVSFITPVCNDKQCQLVEATMVWDPPGYFKRLEYSPDKPLTKKEHRPFTADDYAKLDRILKDRDSILKSWSLEYLQEPLAAVGAASGVDAVTGPTPLAVQEAVVQDAAYTTWALWRWANGEMAQRVRRLTEQSATEEYLKELLVSNVRRDVDFAIDCVIERYPGDGRFVESFFHILEHGEREQIVRAIAFLERAMPDKPGFHSRLIDSCCRMHPMHSPIVLQHLAAEPDLEPSTLEALTERLPEFSFFQVHLVLRILQERKFASKKAVAGVARLLSSDDFFIARRACEHLMTLALDAETAGQVAAFRQRFRERL
ncbi:MAG: hypothetical protein ACOX1P_24980 [Thermoguttaceae bacterium]|jgi:hypothetical protein